MAGEPVVEGCDWLTEGGVVWPKPVGKDVIDLYDEDECAMCGHTRRKHRAAGDSIFCLEKVPAGAHGSDGYEQCFCDVWEDKV